MNSFFKKYGFVIVIAIILFNTYIFIFSNNRALQLLMTVPAVGFCIIYVIMSILKLYKK